MDLDGVKFVPAEGYLAVKFLDEDEDDEKPESSYSSPSTEPKDLGASEAELASVVAVGPKVKGMKAGNLIFTRSGCRKWCTKVGDDTYLLSSYEVLGTVKT